MPIAFDVRLPAERSVLTGPGPRLVLVDRFGSLCVSALVYIAAFAPDKGESVNTLIGGFPADGPQPPILPPRDGFLLLDQGKFAASFAADRSGASRF